jgi:hypothetical protein
MSHFAALVLLDPDTDPDDIASAVEEALAPYDENTSNAPYQSFMDESDVQRLCDYAKREGKISQDDDSLESLVPFIKDWHGSDGGIVEDKLFYWSTYNPMSKWDWYSIGGRWSGEISGYDPYMDPQNYSCCTYCNGTGTRADLEPSWRAQCTLTQHPNKTHPFPQIGEGCNVCYGTGMSKGFSNPEHDSDISTVEHILNMDKPFVPYAIITPDKCWNERGEMHWFGISTNEKDDWETQAVELLKEHANCIAVLCDLHI